MVMGKIAWLVMTAVVALGVAGFAFLHIADGIGEAANASTNHAAAASRPQASPPQASTAQAVAAGAVSAKVRAVTKTYSMKAAGLKRSYEVVTPAKALPKSAPVWVVLAGAKANIPGEIGRDQFVPYVTADKLELVYPVGVDESWNAGGCCGYASAHKVNDVAFLKALVSKVDPGGRRKVYVIGYSNGARLAYRVACTDPRLFAGYAMVKGVPQSGCTVRKPVNLIQIASVNDPEIPYKPGDRGLEPLPVTTLMARLHTAEKCPGKSTVKHYGTTTVTTWAGCAGGSRLGLAAWPGGVHSFPRPPGSKPGANQVIWSFFTRTALTAVPA
jgi:polyhydroxybutyrate depolymerase